MDDKISSNSSENSLKKSEIEENEIPQRPRTGSLDFSGSSKAAADQLKSPMMDM